MAAASVSGASVGAGSDVADGPVLSLINKKLRALKKKYNRIAQLEESQAQGKPVLKEQEDLLKSKPAVCALIDEYEKLRQPLAAALQEELSRLPSPSPSENKDLQEDGQADEEVAAGTATAVGTSVVSPERDLEDLLGLLYFGCLFDVKSQSDFASTLLTRTHERSCCLTYDYVTDDATDLLGEKDLDMISSLGALITSRPVISGVSHKGALEGCIERAKLWLQKSDEPICSGSSVTYAGLREKLKKIMALDYFTMTPEMKVPVDVAAVVGKYSNTASQVPIAEAGASSTQEQEELQVDGMPAHYHHKDDAQEEFQASEVSIGQTSTPDENEKGGLNTEIRPGDDIVGEQDQGRVEGDSEHQHGDLEHKGHQQYIPRKTYQNHRGGRGGRGGGGGQRGYPNGRGGRGGRGGGGGYQNGQNQQYYEPNYYPRNNYNTRGRGGGRSGGQAMYNSHNAAAAHRGQVELDASS